MNYGKKLMTEKSVPLNFTTYILEQSLQKKQVKTTIRSKRFIQKYGLKIGVRIEIKFHRKRIGFAIIKNIRLIGYDDLFNPEIIRNEGFTNPQDLLDTSKRYWKWEWKKIVEGHQIMYLIEFDWI